MSRQNIKNSKLKKRADACHKCRHYYVTWEQNFPHGCRAMGFKSRQIPNIAVRSFSSGMECLMFKAK